MYIHAARSGCAESGRFYPKGKKWPRQFCQHS
jgi:hypothetical protein